MYKFRFNIKKEDVDTHVKNSFSEEEKEYLKNVKFVPFNVHCNENMDIEVTAVGVLDFKDEKQVESEVSTEEIHE